MLQKLSILLIFTVVLMLSPSAYQPQSAVAASSFGFDGPISIANCNTSDMWVNLHYFGTLGVGELNNWRGGYNGIEMWTNAGYPSDFDANLWYNGDHGPFTYPYTAYGIQALEVNGVEVEIWRWDATCTGLDTGTISYACILGCQGQLPHPQTGMISISAGQAQPVYASAGGDIVRDGGGHEIWLPNDADSSGADTFLILDSTDVEGRTWHEIWLGDATSTVWVPADKVTTIQ